MSQLKREAVMALDLNNQTVSVLNETTFFEWLDEALTFAGDNQTSDITEVKLEVGEGNTKAMYAVRVHDA